MIFLHGSCNATAILTALNVISLDRTTLCGSDSVVKIYGSAADFTLTWLFWGQCPSLLLIAHGEYIHFT